MTQTTVTAPATVTGMFRAYRAAKSDRARALAIAAAVTELRTLAEVNDFTRRVRNMLGVQDITALPEAVWTIETQSPAGGFTRAGEMTTPELIAALDSGVHADIRILHPNLMQYGTAVWSTVSGIMHRASTRDFGPSETYLSM